MLDGFIVACFLGLVATTLVAATSDSKARLRGNEAVTDKPSQASIDEAHMQTLIDMALTYIPTHPFAASIVDRQTNTVLCTGLNDSDENPTLHGEIAAINNCTQLYGWNRTLWPQYTLYTTGESCPMCQSGSFILPQLPLVDLTFFQ